MGYSRKIMWGCIFASIVMFSGCGGSSGSSNAKTTTVKEVLTAGMFALNKDVAFNSTTLNYDPYYSVVRTTLDGGGTSIATSTNYYDRSAKSWTNTTPASFPTNPAIYFLSANGTWELFDRDTPQQLVAFNSDRTATFSIFGQNVTESVSAVDISGQNVSSSDSNIPPLLASKNIFPAGSIRYELSGKLTNSSYIVMDIYSAALSALNQIPAHFSESGSNELDLDSSISTSDFFIKFDTGSNAVNIYQRSHSSPSTPIKIGTGTYATITVSGQQILEVTVPAALRSQYSLGRNPTFAVVNGKVMPGPNTLAAFSARFLLYNEIAANHITTNIDTAIAKPVIK